MKPQINMIGIITDNFEAMKKFYHTVMGFEVFLSLDNYVEFNNEGVRFAISTTDVMYNATQHESYKQKKQGQSLELAFKVETPEEVDTQFKEITTKGAQAITEPANMPWGQRAGFFADPDGNIHEIFTDLK